MQQSTKQAIIQTLQHPINFVAISLLVITGLLIRWAIMSMFIKVLYIAGIFSLLLSAFRRFGQPLTLPLYDRKTSALVFISMAAFLIMGGIVAFMEARTFNVMIPTLIGAILEVYMAIFIMKK